MEPDTTEPSIAQERSELFLHFASLIRLHIYCVREGIFEDERKSLLAKPLEKCRNTGETTDWIGGWG